MNITIGTADLVKALKRVEKVAPPKPPNPILSHVLIHAVIHADKNVAYFSTTDNDLSITAWSEATVTEAGMVALPVKHFLEIASHITEAETQLLLENNHVYVSAGYFKTRVQAMNPADFPQLPIYDGTGSLIYGPLLRKMINKVHSAMEDKPQRYYLHGAQLILSTEKKNMILVASDGHRLAITKGEYNGETDNNGVILPAKVLDALLQEEEQEDLKFLSSENHLFFASVHAQITATQVAGVFPAWQKIIPRDKDKVVIPVHRDTWLYAIKRVALASGELKAVTIKFEPRFMTLSAVSSTHGDASEKIAIEYTGGPLTVMTRWTHLVEFLEVAEQAVVNIHLKEEAGIPIKQVILEDGPDHMQLVNLMVK